MIIYAELWDQKKERWSPVRLEIDKDGKETGYAVVILTSLPGEEDGPHYRLAADQAGKLLVRLAECLSP